MAAPLTLRAGDGPGVRGSELHPPLRHAAAGAFRRRMAAAAAAPSEFAALPARDGGQPPSGRRIPAPWRAGGPAAPGRVSPAGSTRPRARAPRHATGGDRDAGPADRGQGRPRIAAGAARGPTPLAPELASDLGGRRPGTGAVSGAGAAPR